MATRWPSHISSKDVSATIASSVWVPYHAETLVIASCTSLLSVLGRGQTKEKRGHRFEASRLAQAKKTKDYE